MSVALGILVAGVMLGVGYLIRRAINSSIDLGRTTEALRNEQEHTAAMERAAAEDRARRTAEFDAKATAVRSPDDAARLLRDSLGR